MRLGSFEIVDRIGEGGMGVVYRASDLKLKRDVALKVLPDGSSQDTERIARLRREAQILAALNHPNIASVYGLEESADTVALVMELVESDTLKGPLAMDNALLYARQIAEALEAAHDKGIIHRDLKPANIKVTREGLVKVLDFGLAAFAQPDSERPQDLQNSPTLSRTLGTQPGMILGTASYMSPEQASGKTLDKRSDIWSFGVVLFEMLTGKGLFKGGETVSHVLADVLRAPIDLSELPKETPVPVRDLIARCLDRDVKNRLRDIGEARIIIDRARKAPPASTEDPRIRPGRSRTWMVLTAAATILTAIAGAGWWQATQPNEQPLIRLTDDVGAQVEENGIGPSIAISPDGLRFAFVTRGANNLRQISVRSLSNSRFTILSGTEGSGAAAPFFSPDGKWIGFFADNKLKKISVEGGAAVTLSDVQQGAPRGGHWGEDDHIWFASQRSPVMRVPSSGGEPKPVTQLESGEVSHRFAQLLPGGQAFIFTSSTDNNSWEGAGIYAQSVSTGMRTLLFQGGYFGRYMDGLGDDGHLLYVHEGTLFAAPMNVQQLQLTGPAIPVIEDASGLQQNGLAQFDVARNGTLVYMPGSTEGDRRLLALMDPTSEKAEVLPLPPTVYVGGARASPDGTRIVVRIAEGPATYISVYELVTQRMTRLTFKGVIPGTPVWAPDGRHLAFPLFSSDFAGPGIYWIRADGAGEPQRLLEGLNIPSSFSPDGKRLLYFSGPVTGKPDSEISILPLDLSDAEHPRPGKPESLLRSKTALVNPMFSPDGRWIAYVSGETQPQQAFVRPSSSDGGVGKWQISRDGSGNQASWSPVRPELFYGAPAAGILRVPYSVNGNTFAASTPQTVMKTTVSLAGAPDLMPDGKRFVVVMQDPQFQQRQTHVAFLLNFSDELQRRTR
jgi:serine/threonine-protein kinase